MFKALVQVCCFRLLCTVVPDVLVLNSVGIVPLALLVKALQDTVAADQQTRQISVMLPGGTALMEKAR